MSVNTEERVVVTELSLIAKFEIDLQAAPEVGYVARRLSISGLAGGSLQHNIAAQRANAIKLLFRFLRLTKLDIELVDVSGGELSCAIPCEAWADILINIEELELLQEQVIRFESLVRTQYAAVEESVSISLAEIEYPQQIIEESAASSIVWAIAASFDGVYRRANDDLSRIVSASNIGVVRCVDDACYAEVAIFSHTEAQVTELADTIASAFELAAGDVWAADAPIVE